MIKINLLSKDNIKKEERKDILVLAIVVLSIAVLGVLGVYFKNVSAYNVTLVKITQTEAELKQYEGIVKQVEELEATKRVLETKKNVINSLRAKGLLYAYFMDDLVSVIPASVAIRSIRTQAASDELLTATLDAEARDNYSIADFITELGLKGSFSAIELGAITTSQSDKTTISNFSITFSYARKNK